MSYTTKIKKAKLSGRNLGKSKLEAVRWQGTRDVVAIKFFTENLICFNMLFIIVPEKASVQQADSCTLPNLHAGTGFSGQSWWIDSHVCLVPISHNSVIKVIYPVLQQAQGCSLYLRC